jgi:hypothetical protein
LQLKSGKAEVFFHNRGACFRYRETLLGRTDAPGQNQAILRVRISARPALKQGQSVDTGSAYVLKDWMPSTSGEPAGYRPESKIRDDGWYGKSAGSSVGDMDGGRDGLTLADAFVVGEDEGLVLDDGRSPPSHRTGCGGRTGSHKAAALENPRSTFV